MANYILDRKITNTSGIYQIINNITQRRYIGCTTALRTRTSKHYSELINNKHSNSRLQNSWNKYGKENFTFSVLQECVKENIYLYEDYWVKVLKTYDREYGYNLKPTDPNNKSIMLEETKQKLRIANKDQKPTAYCLLKRSKVKMTDEHKKACKEGLKKVDWFELRKDKNKKVINIITNEIYKSLTEAATLTNIPIHRLSKYLCGTRTNKTNLKYL